MRSGVVVVKRFLVCVSLLGTMSIGARSSYQCETIVKLAAAAVPV